jgi:hypothetical protein
MGVPDSPAWTAAGLYALRGPVAMAERIAAKRAAPQSDSKAVGHLAKDDARAKLALAGVVGWRHAAKVIGHLKSDGLLERNRLAGAHGDAINAILATAGHNLRLILAWLRRFCVLILIALFGSAAPPIQRPQLDQRSPRE